MSQYEEVISLKSSAVKSAFRRAEQLLASLPDDERETVGYCPLKGEADTFMLEQMVLF